MWLIGSLVFTAAAGTAYSLYLLQVEKEQRIRHLIERMEQMDPPLPGAEPSGLEALSRRLTALLRPLMPSVIVTGVQYRLLWAGRPYGLTADHFFALKFAFALVVPALVPLLMLFRLGSLTLAAMAAGAIFGFLLPDIWLNGRVAARRRQAQRELPLFADLIATSLEAGLSLTEAVRRVASDAPGLVAAEFLRAVQEMAAGKPRYQAWRDLADRVPGDEFRTIVGAIMQAEQYGTSVAEILRYQVSQIRLFKQQQAQRLAQAATVKMRVPMLRAK
jgi:tight adherence protein C